MAVWFATCALALLLAAVAAFDIRTQRIPDALNALTLGAGLVATILLSRDLPAALLGVGIGYGAFWALNVLFRAWRGRDGIGMGDAKLAAALGAWIGWTGLPFAALIASALGLAFVAGRRVAGREMGAQDALAFGPFLALAGFVVWVVSAHV